MKTFFQNLLKPAPLSTPFPRPNGERAGVRGVDQTNLETNAKNRRAHSRLTSSLLTITALFSLCCLTSCLSGCLSRPALNQQTFSFNSPTLAATNSVAGRPVLAIKKLEIASPFEDRALVYRTSEFTYVRDPYAAFLDTPAQELLATLRAGLSSQGNFSAVVDTGSALKPDTLLEINVSQLYGDFRQRTQAQAVLTMRFTFFAATNGIAAQVLFQKEYSRALPISTPSAAALMQGWNQALTEILESVSSDYHQSQTGESTE